jgi:hypothetical protein
MSKSTLIFIYNAYSGFFNAAADALHKTFSPATYQCNLCAVTYGAVSMRKEWRGFIQSLPTEVEFLHRDEFQQRYKLNNTSYPAIFLSKNDELTLFLSADELNSISTLDQLKKAVLNLLNESIPTPSQV